MANKYIIPLGVDAETLINPLTETINTLHKVEGAAKEAGKEMADGFGKGAKSAEQIEQRLKPIQKGLEAVKALGLQAGKELADAFNERNVNPAKFEAAVASVKNKLTGLNAKVDVDIDPAKLAIFEKQLQGATNEVEQLEIAMTVAKTVMQNLDPNSEEFQQLAEAVAYTESTMQGFSENVDQVTTKSKSLKSELRGIKEELARMEAAGQQGSQAFLDLSVRGAQLEDQIGDTNAQIRILASDTATFDGLIEGSLGLVGAFTAVQGAVALFGDENEELEKAMQKVMGAMAVLQGLQQVAQTLNKDSAFSVIFLRGSRVSEAAATAAQTAASATHTTAIAAEAVAMEVLAAAEAQEAAATAAAIAATEAHALANTQQTAATLAAATAAEAEAVALRQNAASEAAAATGATTNAAAQVAQTGAMGGATIAAGILGFALKAIGIGLIITAIAALVEYWDELKGAMNGLLPAGKSIGKMFDNVKSYAFGVGEAVIKYLITPFKAAYQAITGDFEGAFATIKDGYNVIGNFKEGKLRQDLRNQEKYRQEEAAKDLEANKRAVARKKARGEDTYKEEQANLKKEIALKKKAREDTKELEIQLEDEQDKRYAENSKKAAAASKAKQAEAKKSADAATAARKQADAAAAAEAQKQAAFVLKYTDEINALKITSIEDGFKKEIETIEADGENKITALQRDGAKTAEALAKRGELIIAIENDTAAKVKEATKKHNEELAAVRLEGSKLLLTLAKDSREQDLGLLEIENEEVVAAIKEKYKNETDLRENLLKAQAQYLNEKRTEINLKFSENELEVNEQKALAVLELSRNQNGESVEQEVQYQLAILEIKRQAAEQTVNLLLNSGKSENDIEVLNARLKVKAIQDAIADEAKKGKKFDLMKYFGIGAGLSKEQTEDLKKAASDLLGNISEITDGLVDQYQRQIDKKQESIDQINGEIDNLESQLDKEKQLKEDGLANNVEMIEQEIAIKKAQRDEEINQQKEMQRKQAEIQKAQMAVDTAVQLVNMITAATNIFESLSTIPFVGVPLAIGLISSMFGAFALTKVKAFQSINSGAQQFRDGGWIDGAAHEQGGVKYYGEGGAVKELEGREFVVSKKPAAQFAPLLEAINSGNFDNLSFSDFGMMGLFGAMGVDFESPQIKDAVFQGREMETAAASFNFTAGGTQDLSTLNDGIQYLAQRKREQPEKWEDANYYYSKVGSKTTRQKK